MATEKKHRWVGVVLVAVSDPSDEDALRLPTFSPHRTNPIHCFDCGLPYPEPIDPESIDPESIDPESGDSDLPIRDEICPAAPRPGYPGSD